MQNQLSVPELAARLATAAAERTAIGKLTDQFPELELATAYRVQRELRSTAGALAGWKLGLTSPGETSAGRRRRADLWLPARRWRARGR
ncbi:hypothetical protein [Pseudonocardia parietis]|uniref:2-keto-4-pentenoate hydratase n=1 Tax=Pseudonocardia parietis TaxID=570936 RepID=A0ABS4VMB1_9PSEU|nr:hypothetical protein [Pseudonocardia parietis]MBP2365057.1 2-keto-4-pentenoate hydratase [Pseudonocardia parietis]